MEPALWIGPAIVAAGIAALINVAGWFVTFRQARHLELQRRAEKVADVQIALLAEIRSDFENLRRIDLDKDLARVSARLQDSGTAYVPFVPRDSGTPVFSAVVEETSILPAEVIDSVVFYYKQKEAISHFTDDLRSDRFEPLPADRKLEMMADYLSLKTHAARLAEQAVVSLETSLGLEPTLNKTVLGQSDLRSASGQEGGAADVAGKSA